MSKAISSEHSRFSRGDNEIMQAWRQGAVSAEEALSGLTPMLKRLARWAADKYGIQGLADDIQQELAVALLGDAGKKWRPGTSISSYMAGWAWRIASIMGQEAGREQSFDEMFASSEADFLHGEGDRAGMSWGGLVADEETPEHLALADGSSALARSALMGISLDALDRELARVDPRRKSTRKSPPRKKHMTPNARLVTLREAVGLTRPDMAAALGLPLGRYAAFESGKIRSVPDEVYEQAEALVKNASQRVKLGEELADLPMSRIIELWCSMLGQDDPMVVADLLDVSPRTMRRWASDLYKPRRAIVISHHVRVHEHLQRLQTKP